VSSLPQIRFAFGSPLHLSPQPAEGSTPYSSALAHRWYVSGVPGESFSALGRRSADRMSPGDTVHAPPGIIMSCSEGAEGRPSVTVTVLYLSLYCICHCTVFVTVLYLSLYCICHCTVPVTVLFLSLSL